MNEDNQPKVEVGNIMTLWCNRHWYPYHGRSPHATLASMAMLKRTFADERFQRACGGDPETGTPADTSKMTEELEKIKPICCFLGDKVMDDVRLEVLVQINSGRRYA